MIFRAVAILAVCIRGARAGGVWIVGKYRNYASGYSIEVPRGFKGLSGDENGPHRGISIFLPSGGRIDTSGEPNSLEFENPAEGVRRDLG